MSSIKFESLNFFHRNLAKYTWHVSVLCIYYNSVSYDIVFSWTPKFVLSFMDKPPLPVLMRWIFGPLGRGNSRPLSGFVYHKFWQNFWLGPTEVAIQPSNGRAKPTQDSSMSKQTTKPLLLEPTALWNLWPQWVTVPFHNCNI